MSYFPDVYSREGRALIYLSLRILPIFYVFGSTLPLPPVKSTNRDINSVLPKALSTWFSSVLKDSQTSKIVKTKIKYLRIIDCSCVNLSIAKLLLHTKKNYVKE